MNSSDQSSKAQSEKRERRRERFRKWAARIFLFVFSAVTIPSAALIVLGWEAFGEKAQGARWDRAVASRQWGAGEFQNPQPLYNDVGGMFKAPQEHGSPSEPLPVITVDPAMFETPPRDGLRVTWLGHSTLLIEQDGYRVLTDPVFSERTSPFAFAGPKRWYAPPLALADLPAIDAVLISHDHYDHLDFPTMKQLAEWTRDGSWSARFITPLGVDAHLAYWGVPEEKITTVDWWDETVIEKDGRAPLTITCAPARHASGRQILDQNRTLWAGYAVRTDRHRVFFSGDTGMFPGLTEIGERLGPFDVAMVEVGAYDQAWPDWHIGPEQAVVASQMLKAEVFFPIHWGLFDLALHGWTEPIERVRTAALARGVRYVAPRPGESITAAQIPARPEDVTQWWPDVPWRTAEEDPIVATENGDPRDRMTDLLAIPEESQ